jgi:hypothetical protein
MRIIAICLFLLLVPSARSIEAKDGVKTDNSPQSEVDVLAAKVASGEIERIEIFQIPPRVLTRARITPDMLERQYYYKLTIRDVRGNMQQNKLVEAMRSTTARPQGEMTDLRWGIVFYGADGTRVGAIYFDKSGSGGTVDDTAASFKGDLFRWLDESFSGCFR